MNDITCHSEIRTLSKQNWVHLEYSYDFQWQNLSNSCQIWYWDWQYFQSCLWYECSQRKKTLHATYDPTQLQPIRGCPFMVSPCVIPRYKIIPIKHSVRVQDVNFSGFNRFLEIFINTLLRIHSWLMNLNGSVKASYL